MLNELLNREVIIGMANYSGSTIGSKAKVAMSQPLLVYVEGKIVDLDDNFIKLDDGTLIAIKYITSIKPL